MYLRGPLACRWFAVKDKHIIYHKNKDILQIFNVSIQGHYLISLHEPLACRLFAVKKKHNIL